MSGVLIQALIERTDWSDFFPSNFLFASIIALFLTPILGVIYFISWIILFGLRRLCGGPPTGRISDLFIAAVPPATVVLIVLASTALDRAYPERVFKTHTGHEVPQDAALTYYENTSDVIESHITMEFRATDSGLRHMLTEMGFSDLHDRGTQTFSSVQVKGDMGQLTIDWDRLIMRFEYLDV